MSFLQIECYSFYLKSFRVVFLIFPSQVETPHDASALTPSLFFDKKQNTGFEKQAEIVRKFVNSNRGYRRRRRRMAIGRAIEQFGLVVEVQARRGGSRGSHAVLGGGNGRGGAGKVGKGFGLFLLLGAGGGVDCVLLLVRG